MSQLLFDRRVKLTLAVPVATLGDFKTTTSDVLEISGQDDPANPGLRLTFKITKTAKPDPNGNEVTVYNLAPATRARLQKKGVKLILEAGYAATGLQRLFSGDVRTADHVREGTDWASKLKCGDGERSYQNARLTKSFAAGTGAGDVLLALARATGLAIGNVPTEVANLTTTFQTGYCVSGPLSRSIDRLVSSLGCTWSIQDGAIQVLSPGGTFGAQIPQIDVTSGLVGSPEMGSPEKKGGAALIKFKSLLLAVRPGGRVKLVSDQYNGVVTLKKVTHDGDTAGGNWYTEMEGHL